MVITKAMIIRGMASAAILATTFVAGGCTDTNSPGKAGTFYGASVNVGNGTARSYIVLDDQGNPTELGVAMTEAALTGLSTSHDHTHTDNMFVLRLPSQASATPFDHIGLDWNPQGHEPPGIYDLPHFDVHFYMISQQERAGITAVGADTVKVNSYPAQPYWPAGYVPLPGGVPQMGAHWIDPTSPELNGATFTETFLYGSYDGKMIFFEPMITKAYLETRPNLTENLKLPQSYHESGYYPTTYKIRHDAAAKEYRVILGDMVKR